MNKLQQVMFSAVILLLLTTATSAQTVSYSTSGITVIPSIPAQTNNSITDTKVETQQAEPFVFDLLVYNILETGINDEWRDVVMEEDSDVVILVETGGWDDVNDSDFVSDLADINNYFETNNRPTYDFFNMTLENTATGGATILSRFNIVNFFQITYGEMDDGTEIEFHHDLLHAVVDIDNEDVHMIGVHYACCENGDTSRIRDMEAAINYLDTFNGEPFLFTGDFNTFSPVDTGTIGPDPGNLDRETISMLLNETDPRTSANHTWIDVYRELRPYSPGYSYIDNFFKSRIDYIFANEFFFDRLINSSVVDTPNAQVGSDHFPIYAAFNMDPDIADLRPPFKTIGVTGQVISDTELSLSWQQNMADDTESYNIYKDGEFLASTTNETFTYTDNVNPDIIYEYRIAAEDNSSNEGLSSDPIYINTTYGVLSVPHAPILTGEAQPGQSVLNWTVEDNGGFPVDYYIIYRATAASIEDNRFRVWYTTTSTSYIDDRAVEGRDYYYKVSAVNTIGEGPTSEVSYIVPLDDDPVPNTTPNSSTDGVPLTVFPAFIIIGMVIATYQTKLRHQ